MNSAGGKNVETSRVTMDTAELKTSSSVAPVSSAMMNIDVKKETLDFMDIDTENMIPVSPQAMALDGYNSDNSVKEDSVTPKGTPIKNLPFSPSQVISFVV